MAISGAEVSEKSGLYEEEREGGRAPESNTDPCDAKSSRGPSAALASPSCATGQRLQHLKWENVILLRLLELHSQHLHCSRAYKGRL